MFSQPQPVTGLLLRGQLVLVHSTRKRRLGHISGGFELGKLGVDPPQLDVLVGNVGLTPCV
jgi:hypothetical protein